MRVKPCGDGQGQGDPCHCSLGLKGPPHGAQETLVIGVSWSARLPSDPPGPHPLCQAIRPGPALDTGAPGRVCTSGSLQVL